MNSRNKVNAWLSSIGRRHAQTEWSLDSHGVATLSIDPLELVVEVDQDDSPVGISVDLGSLPSKGDDRLLRLFLEANYMGLGTGGATLAIHPTHRRLAIGCTLPADMLDESSLEGLISGLLEQATRWQGYLAMAEEYFGRTQLDASAAHEFDLAIFA